MLKKQATTPEQATQARSGVPEATETAQATQQFQPQEPKTMINAKRTEPRVHCYQRPMNGGYATSSATTPEHLRAVFEAERQRMAAEKKPRRKRRQQVEPTQPSQSQLQLVA